MNPSKFEANIDKISFAIKFNWAEVLFYGFFITYGFFGAAVPSLAEFAAHPIAGVFQTALLASFLVLLGIAGWKWGADFEDVLVISGGDLGALAAIFAVLFGLGYASLSQSLQGDETAYLVIAFGHAIKTLLKFGDHLTALESWPAKYLIQLISILLVGALALIIFLSRLLTWPRRIAFVVGALLCCRLLIMGFGGNPSPHPPLGGLVHLTLGAIFGINDFALKSAYFIAYALFIFGVYKLVQQGAPRYLSLLFALAVATIPLSLHLAAIVENSIWSLICFSSVMLALAAGNKPNYVRLASLVAVMTLFRQSIFIGYVPLLIVFAAALHRPYVADHSKRLLKVMVPSLIFVPFLMQSILHGTPSTAAIGDQTSQLARVVAAFSSGIILVAIANSVPKLWMLFIPSAFAWWRQYRVQSLAYLLFFAMALVVYYAISPGLYGMAKYQAEYALPFAIVGAFIGFKMMASILKYELLALLMLIVIGLNIFGYVGIPAQNKPIDELVDTLSHDLNTYDSGYHVLCGFPYEFGQAYGEVKKLGLTHNSYAIGATYGVFLEITNGYSLGAVRVAESISRLQKKFNEETSPDSPAEVTIENIEKDPRIKIIILGAIQKREALVGGFVKHGWAVHATHKNVQYGSSVIVMTKLPA